MFSRNVVLSFEDLEILDRLVSLERDRAIRSLKRSTRRAAPERVAYLDDLWSRLRTEREGLHQQIAEQAQAIAARYSNDDPEGKQ